MSNLTDFKEELRIALGNTLIQLNKEIMTEKYSDEEKLVINKIGLRFINLFLKEIGIDWNGKTR